MKTKKAMLILFTMLIYGISNFSFAEEKLMHYYSGSLTGENKKIIQKFEYQGRTNYKIKLSFVNYSDSTTVLQYRLNSGNYTQINIESLNIKDELVKLNPLQNGELQIEIKADLVNKISNFISYDILILKKE
jgi:ABC-type glycerol-3-phosphate transport system substrate-binding protein